MMRSYGEFSVRIMVGSDGKMMRSLESVLDELDDVNSEWMIAVGKQMELNECTWERYARFVRAMKRLGYPDCRSPGLDNVTPDQVLDEMVNDPEEPKEKDRQYWTLERIEDELEDFRDGEAHFGVGFDHVYARVEETFEDLVAMASCGLGPDVVITTQAVLDHVDDESIKDSLPLHAVEMHLCKATRSSWPTKERQLVVTPKGYCHWSYLFPRIVRRLGGDHCVCNLPLQDFYNLVIEQVQQKKFNVVGCSFRAVKRKLRSYLRDSGYLEWSSFEHSLFLKAVDMLGGGNPWDKEEVTPQLLLKLMMANAAAADANSSSRHLINLHAIDFHLENFRGTVLPKRVAHLLHQPKRLKRSFSESSCFLGESESDQVPVARLKPSFAETSCCSPGGSDQVPVGCLKHSFA